MSKIIKLYGERNTNTNYLRMLVRYNLEAKLLPGGVPAKVLKLQKFLPGDQLIRDLYFRFTYKDNLGWKHSTVLKQDKLKKYKIVNSKLAFITITKNPYSWLLSLHRKPYQLYDNKPCFEEFLQREWKTIGRDNTLESSLSSPIELWNIKNKSYLQLQGMNAINIKTESLFEKPDFIIQDISELFSIARKSPEFINYERSTKDKNKDHAYYCDYYLSEKWRDKLSREAIEFINSKVDKELMAHYSYEVL